MGEQPFVIVLMGSGSDRGHCERIVQALSGYGIDCVQRVASAHKTPRRLLEMLETYETDPRPHVYITVAGRSNALSGLVDGNVRSPVIACPPVSEIFAGADLFSSVRMPSGVAPLLVLEPANAALAAAKILALAQPALIGKIQALHQESAHLLDEADEALQNG